MSLKRTPRANWRILLHPWRVQATKAIRPKPCVQLCVCCCDGLRTLSLTRISRRPFRHTVALRSRKRVNFLMMCKHYTILWGSDSVFEARDRLISYIFDGQSEMVSTLPGWTPQAVASFVFIVLLVMDDRTEVNELRPYVGRWTAGAKCTGNVIPKVHAVIWPNLHGSSSTVCLMIAGQPLPVVLLWHKGFSGNISSSC